MRSHNFDGLPVLAGMMMVTPNMMLHLAILQVVLQTLEIHWFEELLALGWWEHIIYLGFFVGVYCYYWYNGRYKRIIEKYNLEKNTYWKRHPFVTILLYVITNFVVFFIVVCIKKGYIF
ncbi:hypothetical protein [Bacteroides fragilis]|nr:hypothetical protein [Bacteroides fragilis]